jgi:hypothetical protein
MPGARSRSFRLGDRSELLVQHLLTGIAFTTPVPRQEDIGIDFLCSLITGYGGENLLKAGPAFSVPEGSFHRPTNCQVSFVKGPFAIRPPNMIV